MGVSCDICRGSNAANRHKADYPLEKGQRGRKQLRMYPKCLFFFLNISLLARMLIAYECTPCDLRTCPFKVPRACENGRTLARDPCGCCDQCTRLEWELCGGQDWALGYCSLGLTCVSVNQTGLANTRNLDAEVGVCKALPEFPDAGLEDERCPLVSGCDRTGGKCVCDSRRSCLASFTYPDKEACGRAAKAEGRRHEREHRDRKSVV